MQGFGYVMTMARNIAEDKSNCQDLSSNARIFMFERALLDWERRRRYNAASDADFFAKRRVQCYV